MHEKFKSFLSNDQLFYGVIIMFVGIASFALGQASNTINSETAVVQVVEPIVIENTSNTALLTTTKVSGLDTTKLSDNGFIASKNGTKYHLLDCPGAKQIKEKNRIIFKTKQAAEAAGYTKAANCPELQNL